MLFRSIKGISFSHCKSHILTLISARAENVQDSVGVVCQHYVALEKIQYTDDEAPHISFFFPREHEFSDYDIKRDGLILPIPNPVLKISLAIN